MNPNANHYLSWIDVDNELHCEVLHPSESEVIIGRSESAEVEVFNTSVSRHHLELSWHKGNLSVKDLSSSYGTWIDGVRLEPGEVKTLVVDTEMKLGNLSMWYELRGDNESQEMFQTCFHPPNVNEEFELSSEFNDFRVKLLFLLQENFGDNTLNVQLISNIDQELHQLINTQELRLKEQRILNSISHILNRSLTLAELLKTSLNLVSKVLNAERGFVVIRYANNDQYRIKASRHFEQLKWIPDNSSSQEFSHTLVEKCFSQNKVFIIGDTELNDNLQDILPVKHGGGRSVVVIPLVQDGHVAGVIYLDNQQKSHNFNQQQIPFLTTFAAHTSIALQNTLLYKRAITDDLTQLYTRQHMDEELAHEIQRAQRYRQNVSLLILDLDRFKQINDTYGHTTGDQVLQKFSAIIKQHVRECDLAGRFGGEEFIVILPDTDLDGAFTFAERIRKATEDMLINKDDHVIKITVSTGAASYQPQHGNNALLLLEDADKALYQAKAQGRNQTVICSDGL